MTRYRWIAFSTPVPGREEELEEWYDTQHLPDCLRLDGFVAAQRYRIDQPPKGGAQVPAWRVMVIYEIESEDIEATLGQIQKIINTPAMPMTKAINLKESLLVLGAAAAPRAVAP